MKRIEERKKRGGGGGGGGGGEGKIFLSLHRKKLTSHPAKTRKWNGCLFRELAFSLSLSPSNDMNDPSTGSIPPLPLPPRLHEQQQQHGWGVGGGEELIVDVDFGDAPTTMHAPGGYSSHEQAARPNFQQQQLAGKEAALVPWSS